MLRRKVEKLENDLTNKDESTVERQNKLIAENEVKINNTTEELKGLTEQVDILGEEFDSLKKTKAEFEKEQDESIAKNNNPLFIFNERRESITENGDCLFIKERRESIAENESNLPINPLINDINKEEQDELTLGTTNQNSSASTPAYVQNKNK
eukprot:GHVL01002268.1.p1 GENE.GHVL01002268.1~~GHVL01002268.1.p1  ORF type:complete len:154 (+),score=49.91 GHVL01002268.1:302-763(+)